MCPHHMPILSQSTTSNDSSDRLNSNHPSQFFICPSVFHGDTTHPSNHLHLCSFQPSPYTNWQEPSLTSISHAASDTTGIHFHLQRGNSECQKWKKLSELHQSISDSICSSKIHSTISIKSVSQKIKALYIFTRLSIHH